MMSHQSPKKLGDLTIEDIDLEAVRIEVRTSYVGKRPSSDFKLEQCAFENKAGDLEVNHEPRHVDEGRDHGCRRRRRIEP
jgi:hypothetical protein